VQDALVFVARQHLGRRDFEAAADRHQHEQVQCVGADLEREVEQRRSSVTLCFAIVELICTETPSSQRARAAQRRRVRSGKPRNASITSPAPPRRG
jgi:hypothetical protein